MSLSSARQRRATAASPPTDDGYSKEAKDRRRRPSGEEEEEGIRWFLPFLALGLLRHMSASSNLIHDCDEVFNYWEPLHFLLYRSGFQTWEYSSNFALRSYLYLFIHALVAGPASMIFGEHKVRVFYSVRIFLGLISTITETVLVVALSRKYGKRLACYVLAMLCLTSGCFFASTSFLPSSFSMYAVTLSSALFLLENYAAAVSVAAAGVILGWPFSILVFLPVTVLSVIADYYCYGKWTASVFNLLKYNVFGGGESHLYGTEEPSFYFKNGFNNFNFAFILALLFLGFVPFARKKYVPDLLIVVSPVYIWLAFMSLQAHKEERFLYPIYPLICVAAAAVIDTFPDFFHDKYSSEQSIFEKIAKGLRPLILGFILCASHSRTFSMLNGYGAPIQIYQHLEHHEDTGPGSVLCVGSEWHRYPSSFFIPSYISEVRWIDDGFRGLLPFPFNETLGGTTAAPSYFNDKNKASDEQYVFSLAFKLYSTYFLLTILRVTTSLHFWLQLKDIGACSLLVELDLRRPYPSRGSDLSTWETLAALPFLDRELSPALYRSFFIPHRWQQNNVFGLYKLLRRLPTDQA
uniref:Mannosyltransferase n=1 Tax=Oryza glumipatula TaxID=40148 RepID=A0A0D9Y518_9ORYZ